MVIHLGGKFNREVPVMSTQSVGNTPSSTLSSITSTSSVEDHRPPRRVHTPVSTGATFPARSSNKNAPIVQHLGPRRRSLSGGRRAEVRVREKRAVVSISLWKKGAWRRFLCCSGYRVD